MTNDQPEIECTPPPGLFYGNRTEKVKKVNNGRKGCKISSNDFNFTDKNLSKPACLLNFIMPLKSHFSISKTCTGSIFARATSS
jgi:hypothetical protein